MPKIQNYSGYLVSFGIHAIALVVLGTLHYDLFDDQPDILLETVFSEDREQEEFVQEMEESTDVAETISVVAGGVVSTNVGAATGPTVSQTKIETSDSLKEPEIRVNAGEISTPGNDTIGVDLGEGEVTGETGAVVEGYGAAMKRMTLELMRLMREQKVLVVWLFDESESMKDDQKMIRDHFHTLYQELGLVQKKDEIIRKGHEVLLTSIHSFGKGVHDITEKTGPTSDPAVIRAAIDKIQIDKSGDENMCQSIAFIIDKFRAKANKQKRRLAIIVVSDESGDDGQAIAETIDKAKKARAPIYMMGREAIFGYPTARIRWVDPQYGLTHWLPINRGPETAFPECLQYDGLHGRWDSASSGFGPYEQVRICKESGGIFFLLPGEEENLAGPGAHEQRRFQFLAMKEYQPLLLPRRIYEQERTKSKFRKAIWDVIVTLNPNLNKQLNIREHWYAIEPAKFREEGKGEFQKAMYAMGLLSQATKILENIKPLRAKEDSQRWRAAFDLAHAQCLSYRVRLFQFMLAMDKHNKESPAPKSKKSNRWNLQRTPAMLKPDEQQVKQTRVNFEELQAEEKQARDLYKFVVTEHPGTPWAQRANYEMRQGFGMRFVDVFRDPRYDSLNIKIPKF